MTWNLSEAVGKKSGDEIWCLSAQSPEMQGLVLLLLNLGSEMLRQSPSAWAYPGLGLWIGLPGRTGERPMPALLAKVCDQPKPSLTERPAGAGTCFWPCPLLSSPTTLPPLTLPAFTGKQCETIPFRAQADKIAISFPTAMEGTLPALPGWWGDADLSGKLIWEQGRGSAFSCHHRRQRGTAALCSAWPSLLALRSPACPVRGGPGLPHITRVPACPVPWEPWPDPCHCSGGLPHAGGASACPMLGRPRPARCRKWWRGRPFPPPPFSTVGSTGRGGEYNVENQKCTTVTTVPASLTDPGLAEAEENVHFLPLEPRWLQPFTGKPEGKVVAAAPISAPLGPCRGQQEWATSPPARSQPCHWANRVPHCLCWSMLPPAAFSQTAGSPKIRSFNLVPKRHLLSDTCFWNVWCWWP